MDKRERAFTAFLHARGTTMRQPAKSRAVPVLFRIFGLGLVAACAIQALTESDQWLNGNPSSRHTYLCVVAIVLTMVTISVLRLAGSGARVRPEALAIGVSAGLAGACAWAMLAILPASMPSRADSAMLLASGAALVALAVCAACGSPLGQALLSGMVAAAATTGLTFATAELLIQHYPGRIPNIVGPVMAPGSTTLQVFRENRIEILDGYVGQLFVWGALSLALIVLASPQRRSLGPARPTRAVHLPRAS